jgi:ATP-dependent Zn protease
MNFDDVNLVDVFINWFPMLLIFGVWIFFLRRMQGGNYVNYLKNNNDVAVRQAVALERIAAALEKRA